MVLNVGIVSAFIIYKNRPGAMTRLQKLKKKLKQKPISQKILYSYPVKKIFSIIIILCFMGALMLFLREYKLEIHEKYQVSMHQERDNIQRVKLLGNTNESLFHLQIPKNIFPVEIHNQYLKVENMVSLIVLFFTIPLLILVKQLNFQRLIIKRRKLGDSGDVSGHIEKQELSILQGWKKIKNVICYENDQFLIQLSGEQRFSNNNFYYGIKKVTKNKGQQEKKSSSQQKQQNESKQENSNNLVDEDLIIRKGNIFQARKTIIYISHILNKQINLNIKNGPIKSKTTTQSQSYTKSQTRSQTRSQTKQSSKQSSKRTKSQTAFSKNY